MEKRLVHRLQAGIKSWIQCLKGEIIDFIDDFDSALHRAGGKPEIKVMVDILSKILSTIN